MITDSAAVRQFSVSRPRDGGLSSSTKSYCSATGARQLLSLLSRASVLTSSTSAPARSTVAGTIHSPSTLVSETADSIGFESVRQS